MARYPYRRHGRYERQGDMVALASPRMSRIADRRAATNAERARTFDVAKDAYLDGRADDAKRVIAASAHGLTRTQYKQIARLLVDANRDGEALALLTGVIGAESAKHELAPLPMARVGDLLVCSWGYDQTNIDYYQVVAVVGTSSVRIRKIHGKCVERVGVDRMVPERDAFVERYRQREPGHGPEGTLHRIQKGWNGGYCIRISSYSHASPWDGTPDHETASGYGH